MKIYKISQVTQSNQDSQLKPEDYFSTNQFEDMMQRAWNIHKSLLMEYNPSIRTWQEWLRKDAPLNIANHIEGEYTLYDRFLKELPEELYVVDLIDAYKNNRLKPSVQPPLNTEKFQFPNTQQNNPNKSSRQKKEVSYPWEKDKTISVDGAKRTYAIAIQRKTKSNEIEVNEARKNLFLMFNSDRDLHDKIEIPASELNKKIKELTGLSVEAKTTEDRINDGVPEEYQWGGITNTTYIGRQKIKPEDLDKMVKNIDVSKDGEKDYYGGSGTFLRRMIATSFLAIDTKISYQDLTFDIGDCRLDESEAHKKINGRFFPTEDRIRIAYFYQETVSHEIGHYLDYKFGRELTGENVPISSKTYLKPISGHYSEWANKYNLFLRSIMDKSDISSEYTQKVEEVFARLIGRFVTWVSGKSGQKFIEGDIRNDRFRENDFKNFVFLLQEKSYLDKTKPKVPKAKRK